MAADQVLVSDADEMPISLRSLFAEAEQRRLALENTFESSSSPDYVAELELALRQYAACDRAIAALSLFSPNESLEDLSTSHLPYLLVDHHVATLVQKLQSTSPPSRLQTLRRARSAYERFLFLADSYSLLRDPYSALHARYLDAPGGFSTLGGTGADPMARRNAKIANFRAERSLRERLEVLRQSPRYVEDGGDEELVRELHLANLHFSVHMAFQGLEGLNREEEVLSQAAVPLMPETTSVADDERRRRREGEGEGGGGSDGSNGGYPDRLDRPLEPKRLRSLLGAGGMGPILNKDGRPLQPFTLVATRQEIQKGVFRPGHNLPTMTIDEYLAEERRRGNIIEGGGEASLRREEPEEDDVEKADAETIKAREWDEFKEENPRGWGNTLNRG